MLPAPSNKRNRFPVGFCAFCVSCNQISENLCQSVDFFCVICAIWGFSLAELKGQFANWPLKQQAEGNSLGLFGDRLWFLFAAVGVHHGDGGDIHNIFYLVAGLEHMHRCAHTQQDWADCLRFA